MSLSREQLSSLLNLPLTTSDPLPFYQEVASWVGTPYRNGGTDRQGIDCSALTQNIYRTAFGLLLPRTSSEQYAYSSPVLPDLSAMRQQGIRAFLYRVTSAQMQTGDLVYFSSFPNTLHCNHVGIYLKNDCFLHASTSRGVIINKLTDTYWHPRIICGGRIIRP